MKKAVSLVVACVTLFSLSGCGAGGDTGGFSLVRDGAVSGSISARDSAISLLNHDSSIASICEVYSTPSSSGNWGVKLTGTPIAPGSEVAWGSDGCDQNWDLMVVDCAGNESSIYNYYRECDTTTYFTSKSW